MLLLATTSCEGLRAAAPTADRSPWKHLVEVRVDNTSGKTALSDYQVKIGLNSQNFVFAWAERDGRDLRVLDDDGRTRVRVEVLGGEPEVRLLDADGNTRACVRLSANGPPEFLGVKS